MQFLTLIAQACTPSGGSLLGFPKWYKYLSGIEGTNADGTTFCSPRMMGLNDIWLVGAAILEILLRVAVLLAIGYLIFGGIKYITSQGQPDQTSEALRTIINAVAGLVITVAATALVTFVAGRFN